MHVTAYQGHDLDRAPSVEPGTASEGTLAPEARHKVIGEEARYGSR